MNILKVTQTNKWFVVELGDNRIHMLNEKSLTYFLKHQVGFDKHAIHSIFTALSHQTVIELNLEHTQRRVS